MNYETHICPKCGLTQQGPRPRLWLGYWAFGGAFSFLAVADQFSRWHDPGQIVFLALLFLTPILPMIAIDALWLSRRCSGCGHWRILDRRKPAGQAIEASLPSPPRLG